MNAKKLDAEIEKGITETATALVKEIVARRKKEEPDQFDDYVGYSRNHSKNLG